MNRFFGRSSKSSVAKLDPQDLINQATEINDRLEREGPRLAALAAFLERRRLQNGFGTDFEYTLIPKEAP